MFGERKKNKRLAAEAAAAEEDAKKAEFCRLQIEFEEYLPSHIVIMATDPQRRIDTALGIICEQIPVILDRRISRIAREFGSGGGKSFMKALPHHLRKEMDRHSTNCPVNSNGKYSPTEPYLHELKRLADERLELIERHLQDAREYSEQRELALAREEFLEITGNKMRGDTSLEEARNMVWDAEEAQRAVYAAAEKARAKKKAARTRKANAEKAAAEKAAAEKARAKKKAEDDLRGLGINEDLIEITEDPTRMSIDDIAFIHARGWVGDKTMRPVIDSILNGTGKGRLTVEQGEALYRFREHGELLAAVASGERTTKWAIALMEGGFSESPEAIRMVLGGMSAAAARRAYGLGLGPEPDEPEPEPDEPEPEPEPDEDVIL